MTAVLRASAFVAAVEVITSPVRLHSSGFFLSCWVLASVSPRQLMGGLLCLSTTFVMHAMVGCLSRQLKLPRPDASTAGNQTASEDRTSARGGRPHAARRTSRSSASAISPLGQGALSQPAQHALVPLAHRAWPATTKAERTASPRNGLGLGWGAPHPRAKVRARAAQLRLEFPILKAPRRGSPSARKAALITSTFSHGDMPPRLPDGVAGGRPGTGRL